MSGAFHKTYVARSVAWSSLVATLPLVVLALLPAVVRAAPYGFRGQTGGQEPAY